MFTPNLVSNAARGRRGRGPALETACTAEADRIIGEIIREYGAAAAIAAATRVLSTLDEGAAGPRSLWQRVLAAAERAQAEA